MESSVHLLKAIKQHYRCGRLAALFLYKFRLHIMFLHWDRFISWIYSILCGSFLDACHVARWPKI
uniref:Uncharacterized protein n=1 Tax=Manihot esculenta TaxID=3983 RepID=A0A2C9WFB0_MANES